jgi:hypothetical protein
MQTPRPSRRFPLRHLLDHSAIIQTTTTARDAGFRLRCQQRRHRHVAAGNTQVESEIADRVQSVGAVVAEDSA